MTKGKKIIFGVIGSVAIAAGWYYYRWRQEDFMPSKSNEVTINFGNKGKTVFLRANIWGVSGNHEEIVLSESNKNVSDKALDFIFYTSDVYYKTENDSIITLFAPKSSISTPLKQFVNITVNVKGLNSAEEIRDYDTNYEKYGLKKISVYK